MFRVISGVYGGLLIDRPYVWNGKGGLEWMYREATQMLVGYGDRDRLVFDKPFNEVTP
jgi:hypothetical protein